MRHYSSNYRLVPVYNVVQDQHRFICDPCDDILKVMDSAYVPFQLIFPTDQGLPTTVRLFDVCTKLPLAGNYANSVTRMEKDIDNDGVSEWVYTFSGGAYGGIPKGSYYVEVTFPGSIKYYTETFCHPGSDVPSAGPTCEPNWVLTYGHTCAEKSLGDYSMNFLNKLNLGNIVITRDGEIEVITERKDGFGRATRISTDLQPKLSFEIFGNAWLLDSLSYLKLFDDIKLTRSENSDVFILRNVETVGVGDITGCEFPIKISFTKDALVNTKCCDSIYEQAPVPGNCAGMTVMLSDNFSLCAGEMVTLEATVTGGAAPYILVWSTGETGSSIDVTPDETTTYIVTAIDAFGCVKQDTITVTVVSCEGDLILTIDASPSGNVCPNTAVSLDASISGGSGSYTYLWSTGATSQDIIVSPTSTQTYSLTVTDTVSGDIITVNKTVMVVPNPAITIQANQCLLSIAQMAECETIFYQWQIETSPGDWDPAPGINNGPNYSGESGEKYRLQITCNGCIGVSNAITVTCAQQCTTQITGVSFDNVLNELTVSYATVIGSLPFQTGYLVINESATPNIGNCAASGGWQFVISITLTTESDTLVIPFTPDNLPGCVSAHININAGECTDSHYEAIS